MRTVTIKAFGYISSLLGSTEVVLACDGPLPVNAILNELMRQYPPFSNYVGKLNDIEECLLILSDSRELQLDSLVQPGEKLMLVTPVSGG